MTPSDAAAEPAGTGLPEGPHDAMVVEAEWVIDAGGSVALALSLTITSGEAKGAVVDARFAGGSAALDAALQACGVEPSRDPGDPEVCIAVLAMPCTLVAVRDGTRGTGIALAPP